MIDHITIHVSNIEKTVAFYVAALSPLGYKVSLDQVFDGVRVVGFEKGQKIDTWFTDDKPLSGPVHIAWKAESAETVDTFYKHALAAGGVDNGTPGYRPEYHKDYYAAFVIDPDGNNIEAVYGN